MGGITANIMDSSLIIGAALLGLTILGGVFHFIRLALFSAGIERKQAGVVSLIILAVTVIIVYRTLFS